MGRTENEDEERDQRLVQKVSENDADLNQCSGIRNGGKAEKCFQSGYVQWETQTVGLETQFGNPISV